MFQIKQTEVSRQKGRYFRRQRDINKLLPGYEEAIKGCNTGQKDLDCSNYDNTNTYAIINPTNISPNKYCPVNSNVDSRS